MKKIPILLIMICSAGIAFSQDLDAINEMMSKKDYASARASIDKYLADSKNSNKSDGWYFKGRIYNSLSYEKSTPQSDVYNLKVAAYDAFRKYQQLDPKEVRLIFETYTSFLDLYFGFYDLGANLFNSKNYEDAYMSFKKALEVEDYIIAKKYTYTQATLHPLDTALVLNTAIAATQAKKEDEGIAYYRKLTDANIAGESYRDVYEYLVEYYNKKGNTAALNEMLAKGKRLYPNNYYWTQVELEAVEAKGDTAAILAKYDELLNADKTNFTLAYNYAVYLYRKNKDGSNPAINDKLTDVLKIAINNDTGIDAVVLMANHQYNMAVSYQEQARLVKGVKPEDKKKKADLDAIAHKKMDDCILYSDQAVKYFEAKSELKPLQMANYKTILDYLIDIYNSKGDKKKSDEYSKKKDSLK